MDTAAAQQRGSERGQALIVALGAVFVVMLGAGVLAALGGALAQKDRLQRATDLAALSAARSMRDDFARLSGRGLEDAAAPSRGKGELEVGPAPPACNRVDPEPRCTLEVRT